jgi:hypothetical protein
VNEGTRHWGNPVDASVCVSWTEAHHWQIVSRIRPHLVTATRAQAAQRRDDRASTSSLCAGSCLVCRIVPIWSRDHSVILQSREGARRQGQSGLSYKIYLLAHRPHVTTSKLLVTAVCCKSESEWRSPYVPLICIHGQIATQPQHRRHSRRFMAAGPADTRRPGAEDSEFTSINPARLILDRA